MPFATGAYSLQQAGPRWHVEFPAEPHQRVALLQQEAIAEIGFVARIVRSPQIERPQHGLAAAVRDLEQQRMIAVLGIARLQTIEIGRELHQPVLIARRPGDVGDDFVGRQIGIDREISFADDALIRSGRGESLAVQNIAALGNFDTDERRRQQSGNANGKNPSAFDHNSV
jgi:hypothetical protein